MQSAVPLVIFLLALVLMFDLMLFAAPVDPGLGIYLAIISIFVITAISIMGIFKRSILTYAVYSTAIQFAYFTLDSATAIMIGKSLWFAVIQLINFAVAGLPFVLVITLLYRKFGNIQLRSYSGLFEKNQFLISCLSLGGMPGFNIFIGEYIIYTSLFDIHPALTLATVFASLVAFIFYFRIVYVLLAGKSEETVPLGLPMKLLLGALSIAIIVLGIIPQILFGILELVS